MSLLEQEFYMKNQFHHLNLIIELIILRRTHPWIHMPFEKYEEMNIEDLKNN